MKIWVDADACPKVIKEILFRAAQREQIPMTLIANQPISVPNSVLINCVKVKGGFDEADNENSKTTCMHMANRSTCFGRTPWPTRP